MPPLRCAAAIVLACASTAWAGDGAVKTGESELLTRFFFIAPSLCCGDEPVAKVSEPFPLYGLDGPPDKREEGAVNFLASMGVKFPPGANAVHFKNVALLGVVNTAENLRSVAKVLDVSALPVTAAGFRVEVRVVEYSADKEEQLEAESTFAALEQKLRLRTICAAGGKSKNNEWLDACNLEIPSHTVEPKEDADEWPSSPNGEACDLVFVAHARDAQTATLHLGVRYASPAKDGAGPVREDLTKQADFTLGRIVRIKTFTVTPTGQPVRHLAILARCTRVDGWPDAEVGLGESTAVGGEQPSAK